MQSQQEKLIEAAYNLRTLAGRPTTSKGIDLPAFWAMSDQNRLPNPSITAKHLPSESGIILRHYSIPNREQIASTLYCLCKKMNQILLIAGDLDLTLSVGADGIHLPEYMLTNFKRPGEIKFVTAAVHSLTALKLAERAGADAAIISPIFSTLSHPEREPIGQEKLAAIVNMATIPVYALGGINLKTVAKISSTGVAGIAGVSAFRI